VQPLYFPIRFVIETTDWLWLSLFCPFPTRNLLASDDMYRGFSFRIPVILQMSKIWSTNCV